MHGSAGYHIGVIGCGVAGQAAATFLAEGGHDVTIFERFAEARPLGPGICFSRPGLRCCGRCLEQQALSRGAKVLGLEAKTAGGRIVLDLSYSTLHPLAHGLGIRRGALFDRCIGLKESLARLVAGTEIADVVREHGRAVVIDNDLKRHGPFGLVVVADGAHSALRQRVRGAREMPRQRSPACGPAGCPRRGSTTRAATGWAPEPRGDRLRSARR